MIYSYHIFYFPFKWEIMGLENQAFSDQVNLDNIQYNRNSHWERSQKPDPGEEESLYNEKNYYYTFVHNILYDEEHSPLNLQNKLFDLNLLSECILKSHFVVLYH